jgi:hypothetical protein
MPRRRKATRWNGHVPPPWVPMPGAQEAEARTAYEAAARAAGGCPVYRHGERTADYKRRVGRAVWNCWAGARFDADPEVRKLALLAGVEHLRRDIMGENEPKAAPGGFGGWQLERLAPGSYRVRAAVAGERDEALADLAREAATCGVLVTASAVEEFSRGDRRS